MKKIILSLMCAILLMISFSSAIITKDDVKYVSIPEMKDLWGINANLMERSGLIEVKNGTECYYLQIDNTRLVSNMKLNPFFMNIEGFKIKGNGRIQNAPFNENNETYIPLEFVYNLIHKENEYDIIVVSSEPEGIAAAVSAARQGAKVLLLGNESTPGGLLVHGMLNTLDMNRDKNGNLLTQGIFEEFYNEIGRTESFDIKRAEKFFTNLINNEPAITYKANQHNVEPILEGNKIVGVTVTENDVKTEYHSKIVIDATPDGDICYLAGVPHYTGLEDMNIKDAYMAVTLVFSVSGVDWSELAKDVNRYRNETGDINCGINESSAWAFGKWCYDKYKPVFNNMKLRGLNIGKQEDGTILINALQALGINGLDKNSINSAKNYSRKEIENVIKYLRTILPSFSNAYLAGTADELYIRETRHIQGEYVVSASELLSSTYFEDAIAAGSYPIDIQSISVNDNGFVIGVPTCYTVPYRATVPLNVENLYIIGKSASYSSVAAGSLRVVPVGMSVGESIGIAAVYAISNNVTPRQIAKDFNLVHEVQKIAKEKGVYIPPYKMPEKFSSSEYFEAISSLVDYGIIGGGYKNDFEEKSEAQVAKFIRIVSEILLRSGKETQKYAEIKEKLMKYNDIEKLTGEVVAYMLLEIKDEEMGVVDGFTLAQQKGYFSTIKRPIYRNDTLTNEEMYEIAYRFMMNY